MVDCSARGSAPRGWVSLAQEFHCIPTLGQQFWSQLDFLCKLLDLFARTSLKVLLHKPTDKPRHHWRPAYGAQVSTRASTSEPPSNVFHSCLERTPLWLHVLTKRKRQAFKTQMDQPPPLHVPCSSNATLLGSTKSSKYDIGESDTGFITLTVRVKMWQV